jgi:hypothetical protein
MNKISEMNRISEIHPKKKKSKKFPNFYQTMKKFIRGERTIIFRVLIIYGSKCPTQHISV